jgi:hypothetical protein
MKPISHYAEACRGTTLDQFCEQHPHPFLLFSAGSLVDFVKPYDAAKTPTVDRLVIGGLTGLDEGSPNEGYKVLEAVPRDAASKRVSLGFSDTCDVHLDDPSVSRLHAWIVWTDHGFYLEDNNSTAGTALNGMLLEPGRAVPITPGDRIGLGTTDLLFMRAREFYPLVMLLFGL